MKKLPGLFLPVLFVLFVMATLPGARANAATRAPVRVLIRVLIVDGESGGPYHDWKATTPVLEKELEDSGIFRVSVATAPHSGQDFAGFHPRFASYQAVVLNIDAPDWPAELKTELEQYVRNGGGLVVVHAADNAFPGWPEFNQMIAVGGWRGRTEMAGPHWYWQNGHLVSDSSPGAAGSHGARLPFQVTTRAPEHPIMRGLPTVWMHAPDELYAGLRGPGQNMTVLATAHSDPANQGTGHDEPVLMTVRYGKGRVFHTTLGHDIPALAGIGFMTTFERGTEWAATGRVTQRAPRDFPAAESVSYSVPIAQIDPGWGRAPGRGGFSGAADGALVAMQKRAQELNIGGVAVVAYFKGDNVQAWTSKMLVVGRMKDPATAQSKGSNLLGIAYAKAAEMADTLKDSGSNVRPPMTGEFGWQGGVIVPGKGGFLIAAFSGGKSEDDVQVSRAGAAALDAASW